MVTRLPARPTRFAIRSGRAPEAAGYGGQVLRIRGTAEKEFLGGAAKQF